MLKKIELQAPARDLDMLKAAINAGADAVYIGGESYGMKTSYKDFSCGIYDFRGIILWCVRNHHAERTCKQERCQIGQRRHRRNLLYGFDPRIGVVLLHRPDCRLCTY